MLAGRLFHNERRGRRGQEGEDAGLSADGEAVEAVWMVVREGEVGDEGGWRGTVKYMIPASFPPNPWFGANVLHAVPQARDDKKVLVSRKQSRVIKSNRSSCQNPEAEGRRAARGAST